MEKPLTADEESRLGYAVEDGRLDAGEGEYLAEHPKEARDWLKKNDNDIEPDPENVDPTKEGYDPY